MADVRPTSSSPPTQEAQPQHAYSASQQSSMSVGNPPPSAPAAEGEAAAENRPATGSNGNVSTEGENLAVRPSSDGPAPTNISPEMQKNVSEVLASEHGVPALLNRLKQSIASAKEFALFLQKRSILEEDHSRGLKKLCRMTQENMRRPDHREGTFAQAYEDMMIIHDRMAENASQFAQSLHQMHDDLIELATYAERNRKGWKNNALAAEQKVADLEAAMRKSKTKYDSLAEEYERARTGEPRQGGRVLGAFKPKSAAQHEEDLLKKVQMADQTYHGHVLALQGDKSALESSTRPEAVKALQDLAQETDSGLLLQMQKFAAFNEKLLLSNGLIISPVKNANGETSSRSLRQTVLSINNEKDMNEYIASHHSMIRKDNGEVKYERHPVLNPQTSQFNQGPLQQAQPSMGQPPLQQPQPPHGHQTQQSFSMSSRTSAGNFGQPPSSQEAQPQLLQQSGPIQGNYPPSGASQGPPYSQPHNRSFSQGNMMGGPQGSPGGRGPYGQQQPPPQIPSQQYASPRHSSGQYGSSQGGPPQLGALSFQNSTPPPQQQPAQPPINTGSAPHGQEPLKSSPRPHMVAQQGRVPALQTSTAPPAKPVFGVALNHLYERDGLAVPMVVYQCMQAVDLFGLGVEGIYRQSGSMAHIQKLKSMFDHDSQNKALDFRNPENFYHDVNSVTGLLKQFFRDLPDPLLTTEHHDAFISAAKHEDDLVRRDSLHAIINSLPDPNYATLRAISLHLYRVIENSHVNRMNSHNLAVIFGPTLMGSDPSTAIADAGWQIKVIDTILQNTYQIFDED